MKGPESIEAPRALMWEFLTRCYNRKAGPAERKMQMGICDTITEAIEGIVKEGDNIRLKYPGEEPDLAGAETKEAREKIIREHNEAMEKWMMEDTFAPLNKKQRAFLWSIFYAKDFAGDIDLKEAQHVREVSKSLGKVGTLADMEAEIPEWTDDEESNVEFKPKINEPEPVSAD